MADALVKAVTAAKLKLAPARVGLGTAKVDLNVNRDLFNRKFEWRQEPNPDGPSDKTLAVVEFLGQDNVPIAVYMNYAMHPINFYLSGVISADFPGEASRYVVRGPRLQPSHFSGHRVTAEAGLRGRKDRRDGDKADARCWSMTPS